MTVTHQPEQPVNDAQTWTVIAGFLAILAAMSGLLLRVVRVEIRSIHSDMSGLRQALRAEIGGLGGELRAEMSGLGGELRAEMSGLRGEMIARFDAVDYRFTGMEHRLDGLDRDVHALTRKVFNIDEES